MSDFYPAAFADRIPWHANYNVNVQATGATYGLSAGDKTDAGNDATNVAIIVNYKQAVADFAQAVTEWADIMFDAPIGTALPSPPSAPTTPSFGIGSKASIVPRTRLQAGIIKADADYTPQIGENYGIVAPAAGAPTTPSLVATALTQSQVRLRVSKGGYSLVAIDMRVGGGAWSQIGVAQTAEFIDTSAPAVVGQPEQRDYRAQGMENNARVGALSAVVSAVTVP